MNATSTYDLGHQRRQTRSAPWAVAASLLAVSLLAFVVLAIVAHLAGSGTWVDHAVYGWMTDHRAGALTDAAVAITTAGSPVVTSLLAVAAAAACWWRLRAPAAAIVVVGTVWVAAGLVTILKIVVAEQRPPGSRQFLLDVDQSFPSGHVTGTLALLGILAVVLGRGRRDVVRIASWAVVVVITVAVALSRLYLGVHWLIDVSGAALLGGAAVLCGALVLTAVGPQPPRRSAGRTAT